MKNKKILIIIIPIIIVLAIIAGIVVASFPKSNKDEEVSKTDNESSNLESNVEEKVDIIDVNSKTRPYAIVVNNTAVAVKVQEGLNKAYLVYEIPTEGNTSRLLALYKDVEENLTVGTIRSARHNFIDFALESDAILCCFGWSSHAEHQMKQLKSIDFFQGLYGGPFYRKNPEKLASEHTAYTSIDKLDKAVKSKGLKTTSNDTILLNYNVSDVDLSSATNAKKANTVTIPYGSSSY